MLTAAEPGNVLQGSVLATLQSKLLSGAVGVLFGLLGKLGDKAAINAAAEYLCGAVYQLYRHLYRAAGGNEAYFSLDPGRLHHGHGGGGHEAGGGPVCPGAAEPSAAKKAEFPDLSPEALTAAIPAACQSLTQVLSTTDARLSEP